MYTVKQLSDMAGVSVRTLHYYDEIGLLKPTAVGENGYRYYDEPEALRLQQILFFREMDLGLLQIKDVLDSREFDLVAALQTHRGALLDKMARMQRLVNTIDSTIMYLVGEVDMSTQRLFEPFSDEKQKQYEQEAAERWGEATVKDSIKRWNSYSKEQKQRIADEGNAVYADLVAAMPQGVESAAFQAGLARWHQHLRYFYEPTIDILRGLGQHYNQHPDFIATFQRIHPDLPAALERGIAIYCDGLEDSS
jgi:DNA-binding transcriptional MerR regulator